MGFFHFQHCPPIFAGVFLYSLEILPAEVRPSKALSVTARLPQALGINELLLREQYLSFSAKSPNRISQIPSMIFVTLTGKCSKALGNSYGFYIIFEADTFLFPCAHHTYNVAELNRAIRVFTKYQCCHIRTEIHSLNNFSNTYLPPTTFQSSY